MQATFSFNRWKRTWLELTWLLTWLSSLDFNFLSLQMQPCSYIDLTLIGGFSLLRPQIFMKPESNFETAGKNITLVCKSNGSVTMIWRNTKIRNLTSRDATLKKIDFIVTTKVLEILNVSKQDEGIYECFVKTRRWNDSTTCNVTMKGKLVFTRS